jgi:hypothetical protein
MYPNKREESDTSIKMNVVLVSRIFNYIPMYIYLQVALRIETSLLFVEVDAVLPKEGVVKVPLQNKRCLLNLIDFEMYDLQGSLVRALQT